MSDRTSLIVRPRVRSFTELCSEFPIVLLDKAILCSSYNPLGRDIFTPIKISEANFKHIGRLIGDFRGGNGFYVTSGVLREFSRPLKVSHRERIKRGGSRPNAQFLRVRKKEDRKRKDLISLLEEKEKIIRLSPEETEGYELSQERYPSIGGEYDLDEVDIDLLFTATTLTWLRYPVALLSNHRNLHRARIGLAQKGDYGARKVSGFYRSNHQFLEAVGAGNL